MRNHRASFDKHSPQHPRSSPSQCPGHSIVSSGPSTPPEFAPVCPVHMCRTTQPAVRPEVLPKILFEAHEAHETRPALWDSDVLPRPAHTHDGLPQVSAPKRFHTCAYDGA